MKPMIGSGWTSRGRLVSGALALTLLVASGLAAAAEAKVRAFATPDDAVTALVNAIKADKPKAIASVIGPGSSSWLFSGDAVADKAAFAKFVTAYDQKHALVADGDRRILNVGGDDWPFPVPLVKSGERWTFDVAAGRNEVLARRIGRNELFTIQTVKAIVDAQREYVLLDRDRDGLLEYAQKIISRPGQRDGLYWAPRDGEPASPLGPLMARAAAEGYTGDDAPKQGVPRPYHGYLYRILTGQGKDAAGGEYSYLAKGGMIGGFAVVAYPVSYGASGVMTFIVNHDGVVFQNDLGPGTAQQAAAITRFNPGAGWSKVP